MARTALAPAAYCPGGLTIDPSRAYCPVVELQSSFRTVIEDGCFSSW